jgi:glycerophosphoryl diester phosphodiesterase
MECKAAGKKLLVWTVNEPEHMMEVRIFTFTSLDAASDSKAQAVRWGVDAILTDFTRTWLDMRTALYCMCHHFKYCCCCLSIIISGL